MDYKKEEIDKQTLDSYSNEIKELRDSVKRLKEERATLLDEAHKWKVEAARFNDVVFTVEDMEKCFEMGCKFGRDIFNNPSNTEYVRGLYDQRKKNLG